jgi:hypothetical protein
MAAYSGNRDEAIGMAVEGDVVTTAIRTMMTGRTEGDRMRGTHQRRQTATWAQPLPLKLGCGDGEILEQSRIPGTDDWVCAKPAQPKRMN